MVKAQLGTMVEDALKKIKLAARGLSDNSAKLTETMASYHDTLVHPPPSLVSNAAPLAPRLLVRDRVLHGYTEGWLSTHRTPTRTHHNPCVVTTVTTHKRHGIFA